MNLENNKLLDCLRLGCWMTARDLAIESGLPLDQVTVRIELLHRQGLELEHHPAKGWRTPEGFRFLDEAEIQGQLSASLSGSLARFQLQWTTGSTNNDAIEWLEAGGTGKAVFLAEQQCAGRGRRGRIWASPLGRNIYLSLVWPFIPMSRLQEGLSLVAALSVIDALRQAGLVGMESLRVKWPNDVWLGDGKLAGILLELKGVGQPPGHVVIGIGINVSMRPADIAGILTPVIDLVSQGNSGVDRNQLLVRLLGQLDTDLERFAELGFSAFLDRWRAADMLAGRPVEVVTGNTCKYGVARGVFENGALALETATGLESITGGEVAPSVRLANRQIG